MNFDRDGIDGYYEIVSTLFDKGSYSYVPNKLDLDLKIRATTPSRPTIKEPSILKLKALSSHLCYVYLEANNTLLVIIAVYLLLW